MGIYHSILLTFSFILSVRCCVSFGKSGCSSPGAILGGRLVFTEPSGKDIAEPPLWISGRKIIFVTAKLSFKRSPGIGRGRIWIGQRGCPGKFCPSTYLPCFEELWDEAKKPAFRKYRSPLLQFTDVTPTSIKVTWPAWDNKTDLGSGPISGYQIQIKEAGKTQFRNISVGKRLSYLFENLTENTKYEFRVVILSDHVTIGEGKPSEIQNETTLPRPPSYSANNVIYFTDVAPTSINVSWPAWNQSIDVGSGPISEYRIQIREAGETLFRNTSVTEGLSFRFENLKENTEYEFRVVVFRNHSTYGEGTPSDIQNLTTLLQPPSYSGNNVISLTGVTPTSISVAWPSWNQFTDFGSGPIAEYQIQIKENVSSVFRTFSAGTSLSYKFENLTDDTEYEFRVVIVSAHPNGVGSPSPTQSFKTLCGVHEEDVNLTLTTPPWNRGKLVKAKWQIAERKSSCGAIKIFLNVELMDLDGCLPPSEITEFFDLGDAASGKKLLRNKKPNSLYKVTLSVAYDGDEFYSISDEIRTLDTEPSLAPQNLLVEAVVDAGMLKFEWTKPPCGKCNGGIIKYETSFLIGGRERKDTTEETFKVYSGLKKGDRYTFKVRAENRYGRGPYTEPGCTSVFGTDIC